MSADPEGRPPGIPHGDRTCGNCHRQRIPVKQGSEYLFCQSCDRAACRACGTPTQLNDLVCSHCGVQLYDKS